MEKKHNDIRNPFRLKKKYMTLQRKMSEISLNWEKKIDDDTVKNTRNLFQLRKENKEIKDRIT